jgi:hypothetical protein
VPGYCVSFLLAAVLVELFLLRSLAFDGVLITVFASAVSSVIVELSRRVSYPQI